MSLRREFLEHKGKTIGAFNLVRADVSTLDLNLISARAMLASIEEKITELGAKVNEVNQNLKADIEMQNSANAAMASKIADINSFVNERIGNFETEIGKIGPAIERKIKDSFNELSKKTAASSNSMKEIASKSSLQSAKIRKLGSSLRETQEKSKMLKGLINRKARSVRRADEELEAKIRSQRRRISQLNRKIEINAGRKISARRTSTRTARKLTVKAAGSKIVTKKVTPKKTVITIKTPKRTIKKTVTPKKSVTEKITPKTKQVYEVIKEKNSLI